jgi:hypothetical protein
VKGNDLLREMLESGIKVNEFMHSMEMEDYLDARNESLKLLSFSNE